MDNDYSSSSSEVDNILGRTFFKKYQCIKKLGEGSFGLIYEAIYNNEHFALKFEDLRRNTNLLESEASIMNYLKGPNIPSVRSFGTSGNYNILIMQLMGKSLEDLINEKKTFSIKTVCLLGYQMINALEYIHDKHFVHRDIKPDNFVMGLNLQSKKLYLLDFGLAKKYRSSTTLEHYPLINKKKLTGTARYASINAMRGYEQSRRDDLEAVGYVMMYFLRGSLPWQGLSGKNKEERYRRILNKKLDTSAYDLCIGYPNELETYIDYTRNMEYTQEPDYNRIRNLLLKILEREGQNFDYIYDWTTDEEKILREREFLEEKNAEKTRKNDFSEKHSSKIESEDLNEDESKIGNKYKEATMLHKNKSKEIKSSYKFATKESSLDGKNLNNNVMNSNKKHTNNHKSNSHRRRSNRREYEGELQRENEEVCCTEACIII